MVMDYNTLMSLLQPGVNQMFGDEKWWVCYDGMDDVWLLDVANHRLYFLLTRADVDDHIYPHVFRHRLQAIKDRQPFTVENGCLSRWFTKVSQPFNPLEPPK